MARIPIVYDGPVKITQLPKQDVGEWLSDCLQELARLRGGGPVSDYTYMLIDAISEYFDLVEEEEKGKQRS